MKATQRVSALRGGQPDDLIASGAGCEGISLRGASMRRKIGPNRPGIRGMSDQTLLAWAMRKFKRFAAHKIRASRFLQSIAKTNAEIFVHWRIGKTGTFA